nr:hypothetical protein [Candidatus Frankia alpina]
METVWKFSPKIVGVGTRWVRPWSYPSISLRTAVTLYASYCSVAALSFVQSSPAG